MKVIHVITGTDFGGGEMMLFRYLRALGPVARTHAVVSIMPCGPVADLIRDLGVPVTSLMVARGEWSPSGWMRLRRLIRAERPDLVHGWMYHANFAAFAALAGGDLGRTALVWSIHHSLYDIAQEKFSTRMVLRLSARFSAAADLITNCSALSQDQHRAYGFRAERGMVIPNAIDVSEFRRDGAAKARLAALCGFPPERFIVGNVGRSHPMKDHETLVRAVADLVSAGRDVQAVLVGSGQPEGAARRMADGLGIGDRVTTLEARMDIPAIVAGFDVFLLSSAWGETFSLAVTEAMASEVPCVVTDVGDCPSVVGDCGLVVPRGDALAQSAAIAQMMDTTEAARRDLGRRARARVTEMFSMERYVALSDDAHGRARASLALRSGVLLTV